MISAITDGIIPVGFNYFFTRTRYREKNRHQVRKIFDDTRDVMRSIVTSANQHTEEGYWDCMEKTDSLKESLNELVKVFGEYSDSRVRTIAKDDDVDVEFIRDEELADMQEFLNDLSVLIHKRKEVASTKSQRKILELANKNVKWAAFYYSKFYQKVTNLKEEVNDQSAEKVRERETKHYADIEHDVYVNYEFLKKHISQAPKSRWDFVSLFTGFGDYEIKLLRNSISRSEYNNVYNKQLDMLFGINKLYELVETKRESLSIKFGIVPRSRNYAHDEFPREELLSTLDSLAQRYFDASMSLRTSAPERKENTLFCVGFFSVVANGLANLRNSVKNLYDDIIKPKYNNCICSYDTFLDRINLCSKVRKSLKSNEKKIIDVFSKMKNFIKCQLIEMKSNLLEYDFSMIC